MVKYSIPIFDLQKHLELKDLGKKLKSNFNCKGVQPNSFIYKRLMAFNFNLFNLTKRESLILRARFGISFKQSYTHKEIAKKIKVTKERVRQIECKVLRKLKHPINLTILKQYGDIIDL